MFKGGLSLALVLGHSLEKTQKCRSMAVKGHVFSVVQYEQ